MLPSRRSAATVRSLLLACLLVLAATPLVASAAPGCHPRKGCPTADGPVQQAVTIVTPSDGATVAGTIEAAGTVDANYDRVTVDVAGSTWDAAPSSGAWSASIAAPPSPGDYTLTVEARGPKGARSSTSITISVASDEPTSDPSDPEASPPGSEPAPVDAGVLFADRFDRPDGLITNEFAYWNPTSTSAVHSPGWAMASGSAFVDGTALWSGVPDDIGPDATSSNGTNSAVLRLVTQRADFGDVDVSFDLATQSYVTTPTTPAVDWDGVHVFLRYQSPQELYYVSVDRRDDRIAIKKKVPSDSSNGGTYHTLATATLRNTHGMWRHFDARVVTDPSGSVTVSLSTGGEVVLTAVDSGTGGPPITAAGRVGVRGDNTEFRLRDWIVSRVDE